MEARRVPSFDEASGDIEFASLLHFSLASLIGAFMVSYVLGQISIWPLNSSSVVLLRTT